VAVRPYGGGHEPVIVVWAQAAHLRAPIPVVLHLLHSSAAQPRAALSFVPARSAFEKNGGSFVPTHERQKRPFTAAGSRVRSSLKSGAYLGHTRPQAAASTCNFYPRRAAPLSKNRGHMHTCKTALRWSVQGQRGEADRDTDPQRITEARAGRRRLSP